MTQIQSNSVRTHNEAVQQYALGHLSPAKHMIINCQKALSKEVAQRIEIEDAVASSVLDEISIQPLSPSFLANVIADLPSQTNFDDSNSMNANEVELEAELNINEAINNVTWNKFIPFVSIHNIIGTRRTTGDDRLYLFRAKAGAKIPQHSHFGEEWVLVLKGSYTSNGKVFKKGDVHIVNENETHSLEISKDEECICLAMSEEKIKMTGLVQRMAQKLIGI